VALSSSIQTLRQLCLVWGVYCVQAGPVNRFKAAVVAAARAVRENGFAVSTDQIVVTAGVPFNVPGTTNILRVAPCDERLIYRAEAE
jgi:pyruvate kinase